MNKDNCCDCDAKIICQETVKCKWCGKESPGLYKADISKTGEVIKGPEINECPSCLVLRSRIESNPELARKIINKLGFD